MSSFNLLAASNNSNSFSVPANPATLFVGDLSVHCTERELCQLFCQFGPVEFVQIKRESGRQEHLSYGFVKFGSRQSAEKALQLNGTVIYGRKLRVGWASYKASNPFAAKDAAPQLPATAQIHVTFMTHGAKVVTEDTLRQVFNQFGEVVDVVIKKLVTNQKAKAITGYGFVHYAMTLDGLNAAKYAAWTMRENTVDNIIYRCSVSHGLQQILQHENPAALFSNSNNHKAVPTSSNISSLSTSPSTSGNSSPVNVPVVSFGTGDNSKGGLNIWDGLLGSPSSSFYEKQMPQQQQQPESPLKTPHGSFRPIAMDFSPSNSFLVADAQLNQPQQYNSPRHSEFGGLFSSPSQQAACSPSSAATSHSSQSSRSHVFANHNSWLNNSTNDLFSNFDSLSADLAMNLIA